MLAHSSLAVCALICDGVGVVGDVNVRWDVCSECDKLLRLGEASAVVNAKVCGTCGAYAHEGSSEFAPGAAVGLTK